METLSVGYLVEHAGFVRFGLLSALLLFPRGWFVRLVVALFAALELAIALATRADQATIIWTAVLLGLALLILLASVLGARRTRLSPEEQVMASRLLPGIGRSRVRHFIDQGYWLNGKPGEALLREGEPVSRFCYLSAGEARVMMGGREIGLCRCGDVIGGLGFFSGETAAATVILSSPARFWCSPSDRLKPYFDAQPELRSKVERSMGEPTPEAPSEPAPNHHPVTPAPAI